jgi:hypothetical protein
MLRLRETAPAFIHFLHQIKMGVDPNDILAPGKYGV